MRKLILSIVAVSIVLLTAAATLKKGNTAPTNKSVVSPSPQQGYVIQQDKL